MIDLNDFDFTLEESRIARYPAKERDGSKLMVVDRKNGSIHIESHFRNIESYLNSGDAIFFNETRVSPRRVYLRGGKDDSRLHEAIFLEKIPYTRSWKCLLKNVKKLELGEKLKSPSELVAFELIGKGDGYSILDSDSPIGEEFFEREGNMPIPPYLKREAEELDKDRYQTIFANKTGSVASPTAGLHMTTVLRDRLIQKGVNFYPLVLEIGYGTFRPLTDDNLKEKKLHKERITIPKSTISAHQEMSKNGGRRIAMGTTTLRALEAFVLSDENSPEEDWNGETEIFLYPGDRIDTIDGLITNFHLPRSSLILLVAAFAGIDITKSAYRIALDNDFRFFSYGDAMFII